MQNCEGKESCEKKSRPKLYCSCPKKQGGGKHCVYTCRTKRDEFTIELQYPGFFKISRWTALE